MADFDKAPPLPVEQYRQFQRVIPGLEAIYTVMRAILDVQVGNGGRILVVGAGGGREVEALVASPHNYHITGVDPSANMLAMAEKYVGGAGDRIELKQGVVKDLDESKLYDAATSILVMHAMPDDGTKLAYLQDIRAHLKPGAVYIHVDGVLPTEQSNLDKLIPVLREHGLQIGLPENVAGLPGTLLTTLEAGKAGNVMTSQERLLELFEQAGFRLVNAYFRGLFYTGWWLEAV